MADSDSQHYSLERKLGEIHGQITITVDQSTGILSQTFQCLHQDRTIVRDELVFDGKEYTILSSIEGVFDSPAVFRGQADLVSDETIAFRDCVWMDAPMPAFEEQLGGCAVIPADVPLHQVFANWKPAKKARVRNTKSLEAIAAFMKVWRDDLQQEMAVTNPPGEGGGGKNPVIVPPLIAYLTCLSSCYAMYTTMLGVVAVGLSASTANPAAAVAAMAAAMATLLVALLQCEMACSGAYWYNHVKPRR